MVAKEILNLERGGWSICMQLQTTRPHSQTMTHRNTHGKVNLRMAASEDSRVAKPLDRRQETGSEEASAGLFFLFLFFEHHFKVLGKTATRAEKAMLPIRGRSKSRIDHIKLSPSEYTS